MSESRNLEAALSGLQGPTGVSVREWEEGHFPGIQALSAAEGWRTARTRPEAARGAWRRSRPALVAVDREGTVVGFIRCLTDDNVTTYVAEILVAEPLRGQGLGRILLEAAHRLVPDTRFDLLSTGEAGGFYEYEGFRQYPGYRKTC